MAEREEGRSGGETRGKDWSAEREKAMQVKKDVSESSLVTLCFSWPSFLISYDKNILTRFIC